MQLIPDAVIDWLDPLTGGRVGAGKPGSYDLYQYERTPMLVEEIGKLRVDWRDSVRSWAQHASRTTKAITSSASSQPSEGPSRQPTTGRHQNLADGLSRLGFQERHRTEKVTLHVRGALSLYLKRETRRLPVVIHPWFEAALARLRRVPDLLLETPTRYYINGNLSVFPIYRDPSRVTASRYGIACDPASERSLGELVALLDSNRLIETPDGDVPIGGVERDTDRLELRLARIGQGAFRCGLNRIWDGRCAVTGVELPELLRASHIVPWRDASNRERLDPYNGLLLGAHLDALFDRHLISFADDGRMITSARVDAALLAKVGVEMKAAKLREIHPSHRRYLAAHRARLSP